MFQGKKERKRKKHSVTGSTMADVGFLLLIFFIVSTAFPNDVGIAVKLPPYEEDPWIAHCKTRNVLNILVNAEDEILLDSERTTVSEIKDKTKAFIMNPDDDPNLSERPTKALISLQHDRSTSYEAYIQVYDRIKQAYQEIWEEVAIAEYNVAYHDLTPQQTKQVQNWVPLVVSEAEPTTYLAD